MGNSALKTKSLIPSLFAYIKMHTLTDLEHIKENNFIF